MKLNPVTLAEEPGDVRGRGRRSAHHVFLIRDLFTGAAGSAFSSRSRCGSGSRSCSPTSPKRWPKPAARRRRIALRKTKTDALAKRLTAGGKIEQVAGSALRAGDVVMCDAGDLIPGDGEVIDGIATVDESVITGESAPVIRESGGDRSAVTGGTKVLSDQIKIQITSNPGETFLDRMIALVEGAQRQKTPNEIALNILIAGLTLIFLLAVITLQPYSRLQRRASGSGSVPDASPCWFRCWSA